jgi:acetyl esterase/lipase
MQPRILSEPAPPADIRLLYGNEPSQIVDLRLPAAPGLRPLAIMIHGGFWRARFNLLHAGHLCAGLAAAGFASANIEYRRAGEVGCGWPGTFKDVGNAVQFVRDRANLVRGDARRTVVLGHSAGGHLALWLAGEIGDLAGVVSLGGVASLRVASEMGLGGQAVREFLGVTPREAPDIYRSADPEGRPCAVPRTLIHGTADDRVPIELSREYVRLRQADPGPVKLVELEGGDHFDVVDPQSRFWDVVLGEVMSLVPTVPA